MILFFSYHNDARSNTHHIHEEAATVAETGLRTVQSNIVSDLIRKERITTLSSCIYIAL